MSRPLRPPHELEVDEVVANLILQRAAVARQLAVARIGAALPGAGRLVTTAVGRVAAHLVKVHIVILAT